MTAVRGGPSGLPGGCDRFANLRTAVTQFCLATKWVTGLNMTLWTFFMTQYIPLHHHPKTTLFTNPNAPLPDLHHCAVQRLTAVKNLMACLSTADIKDPEEKHLAHVVEAACLLLQDSCEVLEVMEVRLGQVEG